jgi:hypothetical protein
VQDYGTVLSEADAVARRRGGKDIVVRGADKAENKKKARQIEEGVGRPVTLDTPHAAAGANALPHYHQASRKPAGKAYRDRLSVMMPLLPPFAQVLSGPTFCLHDAKIEAVRVPEFGQSVASVIVCPDLPAPKLFELRYRLVPPFYGEELHPELRDDGPPGGFWLYDEFEVAEGPTPTFVHSILYTGGREVRFFFDQIEILQFRNLGPQPGRGEDCGDRAGAPARS